MMKMLFHFGHPKNLTQWAYSYINRSMDSFDTVLPEEDAQKHLIHGFKQLNKASNKSQSLSYHVAQQSVDEQEYQNLSRKWSTLHS